MPTTAGSTFTTTMWMINRVHCDASNGRAHTSPACRACLAKLADSVVSIDIHEDFLDSASANLEDSGISNYALTAMDATQQLPSGEYDAIVITGSIEVFDPRYMIALKPRGRLFVVVGRKPTMDARLLCRTGDDGWLTKSLFETELVPLVNGAPPPEFRF